MTKRVNAWACVDKESGKITYETSERINPF
jgi:hypothetical protein